MKAPNSRRNQMNQRNERNQVNERNQRDQMYAVILAGGSGTRFWLEKGEGHKIKRIQVGPGARLSLQLHRHRSEHCVVLSGKARVRVEDRVFDVDAHQSTFIPIAAKHRLENPGLLPLQIVEAQIGEYVEEDDIERFDDEYGRKPR